MQHKCKVTVIRKELYQDLQKEYLADPESGKCPFYQEGQEFLFERYGNKDDYWTMGKGSQCSEAWDCISRYVYTALQGGSIMRNWTNDERMMIACCNDGTRPVIFKIERIDYQPVYVDGIENERDREAVLNTLRCLPDALDAVFEADGNHIEVFVEKEIEADRIRKAVENDGAFRVIRID